MTLRQRLLMAGVITSPVVTGKSELNQGFPIHSVRAATLPSRTKGSYS